MRWPAGWPGKAPSTPPKQWPRSQRSRWPPGPASPAQPPAQPSAQPPAQQGPPTAQHPGLPAQPPSSWRPRPTGVGGVGGPGVFAGSTNQSGWARPREGQERCSFRPGQWQMAGPYPRPATSQANTSLLTPWPGGCKPVCWAANPSSVVGQPRHRRMRARSRAAQQLLSPKLACSSSTPGCCRCLSGRSPPPPSRPRRSSSSAS